MQPPSPVTSRSAGWVKKNTEGTLLMQWISYFMIFSVMVIFILEYPTQGKLDWHFFGTVLILGAVLVINILWFQAHEQRFFRQHAVFYHWAFNVVSNLLILTAFAITGSGAIIYLLFMQAAQFARMFGVWPKGAVYSVASLGIALGIIKGYGESNGELVQNGLEFLAGLIFVLAFVLLEKRSSDEACRAESLLKDLQAANVALQTAHQKEKELAIAEERMHLARDIHDGLGHHLTVLSIQLQAAEKLVGRNPEAAAEAIRVSRGEAQAALEEVRHSVGMMRKPPAEDRPLVEMIATLVSDFNEHTKLKTGFECTGNPIELSVFAEQTLFRAVQESLTNVQKHARGAKHIKVRLAFSTGGVHLAVSDDGMALEAEPSGQVGYGLKGLRERVEQLGGEFHSGLATPSGFQVDVGIPVREDSHD